MLGYILRRILQLIPVLFGISIITFTLSFVVPGDPVRSIMGQRSDREIELRIRQKFGLDKPWYIQYFIWVRNLIRNPGDLPQCKLRAETDGGATVYQLKLQRDTVLATDGALRRVANEPFQRRVLTHLLEPGCPPPDRRAYSGGTTQTLVRLEVSTHDTRALLQDFQGKQVWYSIDPSIEVCAQGRTGGIELSSPGGKYSSYFSLKGLQTGRDFTAIFDATERRMIDGMYDDRSIGHSEIAQLPSPVTRTIRAKERTDGDWFFSLEDESGRIERVEMMPNAVLMIGGNRAAVAEFVPGLKVNVAFTQRGETAVWALYDAESSDLEEVAAVREAHPESTVARGKITDVVLSPAVWFDFGRSYRQQREVREIISGSFLNTAYLSTVAMIIAIIVGITAGIISAVRPYSFIDYITMTAALMGVSMPVFWLGLMLILLFQGELGWIGGTGYGEIQWIPVNLGLFTFHIPWHQQVILPAVTLATVPMAIIARMTRSSMLEVMNLDYIRTARAKGLAEWTVIMRHALKNSLIPIITVIGLDFAFLLAGAVLTETVFSWPGLGREIVDAIEFRDFPVVMAGVVLFAFVFVMANLVVDILYAYVDPRIRYQ